MSSRHLVLLSVLLLGLARPATPGEEDSPRFRTTPAQVGHVFPHMTVMADGAGSNSETGIGGLIPWANTLWAVGYVAHIYVHHEFPDAYSAHWVRARVDRACRASVQLFYN